MIEHRVLAFFSICMYPGYKIQLPTFVLELIFDHLRFDACMGDYLRVGTCPGNMTLVAEIKNQVH
jgi:hypothetical protein